MFDKHLIWFQARLKVLKARDDHVAHVLDDAKQQLSKIAHDRSKYPAIIEKLIAQVGWRYFSQTMQDYETLELSSMLLSFRYKRM